MVTPYTSPEAEVELFGDTITLTLACGMGFHFPWSPDDVVGLTELERKFYVKMILELRDQAKPKK